MRTILAGLALALLLTPRPGEAAPKAGPRPVDPAAVEALAERLEPRLRQARYMDRRCEPVQIPRWEGYETRRCEYQVKDAATGVQKAGLVALLDPSALQLATWIAHACAQAAPEATAADCARHLELRILGQSSGHFPVAGVVLEDVLPEDGVHEAYAFRDGVTVRAKGFEQGTTEPLDAARLAAATGPVTATASKPAPARLAGVTRAEFKAFRPAAKVEGLAWLETVRAEYQRAWRSERNALLEAWLRAHPP